MGFNDSYGNTTTYKLLNQNPLTTLYDSLNTVRKYQQNHASKPKPRHPEFPASGASLFPQKETLSKKISPVSTSFRVIMPTGGCVCDIRSASCRCSA